jgi:hypothetical protein
LPGNSPNHLANTAVHICQTIRYIFPKNVHICLYMSIHVHMRAYVCIYRSYPESGRAWPVLIPVWIGVPPLRSASPATGN